MACNVADVRITCVVLPYVCRSCVLPECKLRNRCNWRVGVNIAQADCVQDKVVLEVALGISG